jgi:hypothetical protein
LPRFSKRIKLQHRIMKFINKLPFLFLFLAINQLNAQTDFKFGFRAGATISTMFGPMEKDDQDISLEKYRATARICVGGTISMPLTNRLGLSAEVLFSQKGAMHRFEADNSYLRLDGTVSNMTSSQTFIGHKRIRSVNITNGYVEIPITFYAYAIKDRLMFDFGPSISFLVTSRSLGILKYGVIDPVNPDPTAFMEIELDLRNNDEAGALAQGALDKTGKIDQTTIVYPSRVGSFYNFDEKKGGLFNSIDYGINLGASLFFTKGLRVGTRVYYGLADVTNNRYDVQQRSLNTNREFIFRKDRDTNFGVQMFIALQF